MSSILSIVRSLVQKESARLIAYSSAVAVAAALKVAEIAGVTLTAEILAGVSGLAVLVTTELIRRFVYSQATVEKIASEAAATGNAEVGPPPSGETEDAPLARPYTGDEEE